MRMAYLDHIIIIPCFHRQLFRIQAFFPSNILVILVVLWRISTMYLSRIESMPYLANTSFKLRQDENELNIFSLHSLVKSARTDAGPPAIR